MKYDIIIGIDPDIEKDGFAVLYPQKQKVEVYAYPFGKTLSRLMNAFVNSQASGTKMLVIIEAGWLNKGNFHLRANDTKPVVAAKGVAQGRNHQRGIDISEYCQYNHIPYRLQAPLRKVWRGKDKKISQAEIENILGYPLRSISDKGRKVMPNQEMRDALLLAWAESGLPFKIL